MSYRVNPETMLFDDLNEDEAIEVEFVARGIVLLGKADLNHQAFVAWAKAANYDDRQALLVYATAFPQRALLSVLDYFRKKHP